MVWEFFETTFFLLSVQELQLVEFEALCDIENPAYFQFKSELCDFYTS